jgi:phosphohistidine phosphatase
MKTLYLVRHAKSSWEDHLVDHERILNERGKKDSVLVANYAASAFVKPSLMLSSTATRAYTTALEFKKAFGMDDKDFTPLPELYDFSGNEVLKIIESTPDDISSLMVFGHNYGLTQLVNKLGNKYIDNLPTTGLVQITFMTDTWKNLSNGKTTATVFPKDLR